MSIEVALERQPLTFPKDGGGGDLPGSNVGSYLSCCRKPKCKQHLEV